MKGKLAVTAGVLLFMGGCGFMEETKNSLSAGGSVNVSEADTSIVEEVEREKPAVSEDPSVNENLVRYGPVEPEAEFPENISTDLYINNDESSLSVNEDQWFPEDYTDVSGVTTFRGGPLRDRPAYGTLPGGEPGIKEMWSFTTGADPDWGGGAGWTGQPVIVQWDSEAKKHMNLASHLKEDDSFTEVIQGSLDGKIYFLNLDTGEQSRPPIENRNPVKGSVAIDPRGYPVLYVGDGVPTGADKPFGFNIYSLIDGDLLHHIDGRDELALREWGAFDSSAIVNRETDTLIVGGENGMFYHLKLNTDYDREAGTISLNPEETKLRYRVEGNEYKGIESSVAVYRNLAYFSDNGGSILGVDIRTMEPFFSLPPLDDTDSTIVLDVIDDVPYLYTATEVDNIGEDGDCHIRKINGLTGEVLWEKTYSAYYYPGVVGGVLATPVLGKKNMEGLVVFTVARHGGRYSGIMAALDKETGEEVWRHDMPHYAWSSAVDVYDEEGNGYLIQADFGGDVRILEGTTGETITRQNFGFNIEASPAVFNNKAVFASRGGRIHAIALD
ncbi:outer membrane protein assembly factor BamB family protein [Alteribacter natronophilus]|uniref:outer membrane protein assembly factor BamB family protein n=1 Tax=Alteribacter natronophilus TaxID=2583810 RepID=UPI00110E2B18|nr:PQQ-binding-like beta-propeller repeat protein [Alteribacter natronophilus]TMW73320.1 pyrrolo-quinoline quinone [Alteribacter natronophilus]